ncbi:RNA polymerase sigma factor [Nonomuraea sp. NPDC050310]|uniref:RNA polymerase sigma factor n=1 Tax=unclassified Nonomuraea TaxID=2593643 RepID=UPI0033FE59D2
MTADAELIGRSLTEPEAFARLFDRHADELFRYAARRLGGELAEDVVGEVFLTAFRRRADYDRAREDARPWLYGIATRVIAQHRRAERRRTRALARLAADRPGGSEAAFDERSAERVSAQQLQPRLARALTRLNAAERDLLLLLAWADLSYEDAALALAVPVGTVRSRLHRLRAKVRRDLGPFVEERHSG